MRLLQLHVPYSYGWSIILLTALVKLVTLPLTKTQVRHRLQGPRHYSASECHRNASTEHAGGILGQAVDDPARPCFRPDVYSLRERLAKFPMHWLELSWGPSQISASLSDNPSTS